MAKALILGPHIHIADDGGVQNTEPSRWIRVFQINSPLTTNPKYLNEVITEDFDKHNATCITKKNNGVDFLQQFLQHLQITYCLYSCSLCKLEPSPALSVHLRNVTQYIAQISAAAFYTMLERGFVLNPITDTYT